MGRRTKRILLVCAIPVVLVLAVIVAFGPLVRGRVNETAARYGLEVEVDSVAPRLDGLHLRGVVVRHPDAPSIKVRLEEVTVGWSEPRNIAIDGGTVAVDGSPATVLAEVERVRGSLPTGSGTKGAPARTISLKNLALSYKGPDGTVEAKGLSVSREEGRLLLGTESGEGSFFGQSVTLSGAKLELEKAPDLRLAKFTTESLVVRASQAAAEDAPAKSDAPTKSDAPAAPASLSTRVASFRRSLDRASLALEEHTTADAVIQLGGLRGELARAGGPVGIGPGQLKIERHDGRFSIEYRADVAQGSADGLLVKMTVPKLSEALAVSVHGGPVTLEQLGVHDGNFKLENTASTTVRANARFEIDAQGEVFSFNGDAKVEGLSGLVPQAAKEPLKGANGSFRGSLRLALDGSHLEIKGGELELGSVRLNLSGTASRDAEDGKKVDLSFEVPLVPCQALLDAAPKNLMPTLAGMRLAGSFALKGGLKFDTRQLDKTYRLPYDIASTCRVTEAPPAVDVARFRKPFTHRVYAAGGEQRTNFETGPGTANWVSYNAISRHVSTGLLGFEDGRFMSHEGFDHEAIRNSVRENIRKWRFVRGASTLSMQLAKNLYLSRDKLLGRKIEEAFLTMYLEQALTKEQILELYLNLVEFGPGVYGIENGAAHLFRTSPGALSISQAFYLASILPSPKVERFAAGGAVSGGWLKLLRTVMKHSHKRHRLSDEELAAGLAEIPVRGSSAPMKDPNAEIPEGLIEPPAEPGVPLN